AASAAAAPAASEPAGWIIPIWVALPAVATPTDVPGAAIIDITGVSSGCGPPLLLVGEVDRHVQSGLRAGGDGDGHRGSGFPLGDRGDDGGPVRVLLEGE